MQKVPVVVVGASGYTGAELIRLLLAHPRAEIVGLYAKTSAGQSLGQIFPQFRGRLDLPISVFDADEIAQHARVAFCGLPHGESAPIVRTLYDRGLLVIDLSADFRLRDAKDFAAWYGHPPDPLHEQAVYGLPEVGQRDFAHARLIAVPGCYPTAAILALAPLLAGGLIDKNGIVIDAKSGVSGAGRKATEPTHFPEMGEGVRAYKVAGSHRHTPEIEQELGIRGIVFTPHLIPMSRGILATCYAVPTDPERPEADYRQALENAYGKTPFVTVIDQPPDTTHVRGSNRAHLFVTVDERARRVIAMCAIDNLTKGASGQAVQCMNRALGFAETDGLDDVGIFP